ncbi:MAG: NeuD/PglB/VioB family sugar acetyltransferase [Mobilitalea sp.]
MFKNNIYRRFIKRPMDIVMSFLAIVLMSPFLVVIAVLVRGKLGAPILFKQNRPGLNEKIITLYKFRSMTNKRDNKGDLLPDQDRLIRFGKQLRATSLDELPELFNILKGDMSIVGPRPLLVEYLPLYSKEQKRRHEVRPGLSGLAQTKGRNAISWKDKFKYDIAYVDNITFLGDMKIIFMTIMKVIKREGINSKSMITAEIFKGNEEDRRKLLIIGASGHGKAVAEIAIKMNRWTQVVFLDDDKSLSSAMKIDVIGTSRDVLQYIKEYDIFIAIGNNEIREKLLTELETAGASIPILIHPSAIIGEEVEIEAGTVIMAGVVINCCSRIGKGCIINTSATVDHDNVIESYVHLSPGVHLAGAVKVGKSVWLGIGSIVKNNLNIVGGCKVGAGAVVVKDIIEVGTYVGVPARKI